MYKREDSGSEFFYVRDNPPDYSLDVDKALYVYVETGAPGGGLPTIFLDKFGFEWELLLESEVGGITYMGIPISRVGILASWDTRIGVSELLLKLLKSIF